MNVFKKKKLLVFLENSENRQLIVWFLTLVSYVLLFVLLKNSFVLLFGYFAFFFIYGRVYNFILKRLQISFKENHADKDFL